MPNDWDLLAEKIERTRVRSEKALQDALELQSRITGGAAQPRLTLIQGGGDPTAAPLPTTRAELRVWCERLEAQLTEPGGDDVA